MTANELKEWMTAHFDGNISMMGRQMRVQRATIQQWLRRDKVPEWVVSWIELFEYKERTEKAQHKRAVDVMDRLKDLRK